MIRRTDSLEKTLMLGKTEGRRRRGQQDEMVGWHHRLDGHEFEQTLEVGGGQGSLACCSPWGHKVPDMTERQNGTELVAQSMKNPPAKKETACNPGDLGLITGWERSPGG